MIIFLMADTHKIDKNVIKHLVREAVLRKAELLIHCGDIEKQHVDAELFGNLPVVCALTEDQLAEDSFKEFLKNPPPGWRFTTPGSLNRVLYIGGTRFYVGHKRSYDLAFKSEANFKEVLDAMRRDFDGLRFATAGHMHHQTLAQTLLVTFINPGAVSMSPDGYEFAVLDTETGQVVFSRIPKTTNAEKPFTVGVISDSLNISKLDAHFWEKLAKEFADRGVSQVIHCGNIAVADIGRPELADFQMYYRLRSEQGSPKAPENWHLIPGDPPIVTINERKFYVHPSLARIILEKSEADMHGECMKISGQHPDLDYILYGGVRDSYLSEEMDGMLRILNPGDARSSRNFAAICFPRNEITIGVVPCDPLPIIE